ncbi:hypothetical protein Glove_219g144 [Diversispora epigaea]|uniref:Uncharacterized protein n=1 Tax=Diversispora epigaea TaxID=1348612 RepID=A0A397IGD3_9GLOM|nr:hypothetical protein Glove_219g144 [Diversispora epigaea]
MEAICGWITTDFCVTWTMIENNNNNNNHNANSELEPRLICNQELFLYEIKSHSLYRNSFEEYTKILSQCSKCEIEIESTDITLNTNAPMQISQMKTMAFRASNPIISHIPLYPEYADQTQA